jgi:hypothetical protein
MSAGSARRGAQLFRFEIALDGLVEVFPGSFRKPGVKRFR